MSISGFKQSARELMLKNAPKLFIVTLIYVAVTTLLPMLSSEISGANAILDYLQNEAIREPVADWLDGISSRVRSFGVLLSIVIALFTPIVNVGFMSYSLKISRGESGDYRDLLDGFMMFGKILALSIMMGILVFLWSLLFIFPGIVAGYRYSQAYYILLDNPEMGILDCIRESKSLMRGNKLDLFLLQLSFIGWSLLAVIVQRYLFLPIVYIWLQPYMSIAGANFYNYLIRYNPEAAGGVL